MMRAVPAGPPFFVEAVAWWRGAVVLVPWRAGWRRLNVSERRPRWRAGGADRLGGDDRAGGDDLMGARSGAAIGQCDAGRAATGRLRAADQVG